jgi:peptidoglycan/LPS O-acetylase OafA/YrhL
VSTADVHTVNDAARRRQLPSLTGARFVAALAVVVYHLWRWDAWAVPGVVEHVVGGLSVAVSFFFVLSGFVLAWSGLRDDGSLRLPATAFWRGRLRRLAPTFWLATVVALPTALALLHRSGLEGTGLVRAVVLDAALSLSFLQAFVPGHELAINPPAWSLSAEMFFSLLFPLLAPPLFRLRAGSAVVALVGLWLLSWLPGLLYLVLDPDGLSTAGIAVDHRAHAVVLDVLRYHPLLRLPEFLAGIVAARLFLDGRRVPTSSAVVAVVVVIAVLALGLPAPLVHNGLLVPAFIVLVLALASMSPTMSPTMALSTSSRWWQRLGDSSYALYLLHVPLLYWIAGMSMRRLGRNVLDEPLLAALVVVAIVVVAVSVSLVPVFGGRRVGICNVGLGSDSHPKTGGGST